MSENAINEAKAFGAGWSAAIRDASRVTWHEEKSVGRQHVEQERKDWAETLRLVQLALHVDWHGFEVVAVAHWVHTGQELPTGGDTGPDAATWTAGDEA